MNKVAKFEKVSYKQFKKDFLDAYPGLDFMTTDDYGNNIEYPKFVYDNIKLPQRATNGSAGYDFFLPVQLVLDVGENQKVPTGIRCFIEEGWVLEIYPRSGQGFKYGVHLANTVGIIDSDYYNADNEGHIFVKLINDSSIGDHLFIDFDEAFCQGVFVPFGVTYDDDANGVRVGGLGSTTKE